MDTSYRLGQRKIIVKFYEEDSPEILKCGCGWRGTTQQAASDGRRNQQELKCPHCRTMLALISEMVTGATNLLTGKRFSPVLRGPRH